MSAFRCLCPNDAPHSEECTRRWYNHCAEVAKIPCAWCAGPLTYTESRPWCCERCSALDS